MKKFIQIFVLCFILNFVIINGQAGNPLSTSETCLNTLAIDVLNVTVGQIKSFTKNFTLAAGYHQLSFMISPLIFSPLDNSNLKIMLNGALLQLINIPNIGFQFFIFGINAIEGLNILTFQKITSQLSPFCLFFFNVVFVTKPCMSIKNTNLIVNGDFQQNSNSQCRSLFSFCVLNTTNYVPATVPGWVPENQMQFGLASVYQSLLPNTIVSQLDPSKNSCMKQKLLSLTPGKYALQFIWTARFGKALYSSSFSVQMGSQTVKCIVPTNYRLNTERIQFTLANPDPQTWIKFCGQGTSDSFGALIDNVKLFYLDGCGAQIIQG